MRYAIKCNFKEKLIELDIARFLGAFTPHRGNVYYLEDSEEQLTGADLRSVDMNVVPIYLQVKVSQGLKTVRQIAPSTRKNRSYLEDIREFRGAKSLDEFDDHFLYFQLRKKAEGADDFQHNILMSYSNNGYSHSFYVAPLILDKTRYEKHFLEYLPHQFEPFYFSGYRLIGSSWISHYGFIPFLRNHISITPHELVDTHEHYYAYSQHGTDVTWHSPSLINVNPSRLSDALVRIFRNYYNTEKKETLASLSDKIAQTPIMLGKLNEDLNKVESKQAPIDILSRHAYLLYKHYSIKQVLFLFPKK